jgi:hypothetical protein
MTGGCNREPRVVKPVLNQECRELGTGIYVFGGGWIHLHGH